MSPTVVYDFESNVAAMVAAALASSGLHTATLNTAPEFQKIRPRSEIIFRPGGAASPTQLVLVNGRRCVGAYIGDLEITSLTDASTTGKATHATYRSTLRQLMELDAIRAAANTTAFPYRIDFATPTGSSETFKTEDGYELSRLTYHLEFSIKTDALNQLAT